MPTELNASHFIEQLDTMKSPEELEKIQRYFKMGEGEYAEGDIFIGVRMKNVFDLAKAFIKMPLDEIEKLLASEIHEARAGALKIMALQAKHKNAPEKHKFVLFDLYLRCHERINNWDLVDLGAWDVVGRYLYDKPHDILYTMAESDVLWERRTAMLSTLYFIRQGDLDDTFKIAEMLLNDEEDLIHKPIGSMLREAGKHDKVRLINFLNQYAATMPRVALRYAIDHFEAEERSHYLNMKNTK